MINSKGLEFQYDAQNAFQFPDFVCEKNNELLVIGPSGVGKTTFLHLLCGFLRNQKGSIEIDGKDISQLSEKKLDQFRAKHMGIVLQDNYFIPSISVKENLRLAMSLASNKIEEKRIENLSKELSIEQLLDKKPQELSRGEQQRANIIRAVINSPKVILADEPTSSLDDQNCKSVLNLLRKKAAENQSSLLIVTHDSRLKSEFKKSIQL